MKNQKYGHQEDDLDYFQGVFREEQMQLQKLDLGDDFKYPSDQAFAYYFSEYDFVQAMKGNGLRKWGGMVKDYPLFCRSYHALVFAQREHYIHKIMALEYMVPESIKKGALPWPTQHGSRPRPQYLYDIDMRLRDPPPISFRAFS